MSIERTVKINPTIKELAHVVAWLDNAQQADFFNELNKGFNTFPDGEVGRNTQIYRIGDILRDPEYKGAADFITHLADEIQKEDD